MIEFNRYTTKLVENCVDNTETYISYLPIISPSVTSILLLQKTALSIVAVVVCLFIRFLSVDQSSRSGSR